MQIEKLGIVLRPRTASEAIDLGFLLIKAWVKPFYWVWFCCVLPFIILIYLGYYAWLGMEGFFYALLTVWWLKPLYDRITLHFLSRAVFGEILSPRELWGSWRVLFFNTHLFWGLSFARFSFVRSFVLPLWQLEGLDKRAVFSRYSILQKGMSASARNLMGMCVLLETVLTLAFFSLCYWFIPVGYVPEFWQFLFLIDDEYSIWLHLVGDICYLLALSLIEPCYVAAGFMLYLNRRVHLEGWDIQLGFEDIRRSLESDGHKKTLFVEK